MNCKLLRFFGVVFSNLLMAVSQPIEENRVEICKIQTILLSLHRVMRKMKCDVIVETSGNYI